MPADSNRAPDWPADARGGAVTRVTSKAKLAALAREAARRGNWMVRFARTPGNLCAFAGFRWAPLGQWTEAPDWDPKPRCGGGLHGQGPGAGGYRHDSGPTLVFCETDGAQVTIDGNKVKVRRARRLLIDTLPAGLNVGGWLDLSGCTGLRALPAGLNVGGGLDLYGCTGLRALPAGLSVGGSLDLTGCTGLPAEWRRTWNRLADLPGPRGSERIPDPEVAP